MSNKLFMKAALQAARNHGAESEPDHEIGDLQDMVSVLAYMLTPEQIKEAAKTIASNNRWFDLDGFLESFDRE